MKDFQKYEDARAYAQAQAQANADGISRGIEKNDSGLPGYGPWVVKMLPRKENRYGWELRCEAVEPEVYYQRCTACGHTLLDHERDGWICDCTACPWKSYNLKSCGFCGGLSCPHSRKKSEKSS